MTKRSLPHAVIGAAVGAVLWTATEYSTHRWILHGPFTRGSVTKLRIGSVHRSHHRDPDYTSTPLRLAGHLAVGGAAALGSVGLATALPTITSRALAATWSLGYSCYEISHWNFHHRPARTALGQRLRDRHHQHHFGAPASNLGVTMTFWDRLLGTEAASARSAAG